MRRIDPSATEMPFLDHLEELRWRIIYSLAAVAIGVIGGYVMVVRFDLVKLLAAPIVPYLGGHNLMATHPTDGFRITVSAALWVGVVAAFPFVVYQAWMFLSPALYSRERRLLSAALAGGSVLFAGGAYFAFKIVLPLSLPWLFGFFGTTLDPMITRRATSAMSSAWS